MIHFKRYELNNGLRVLIHQDASTPLASVCMTYDVGTRDEAASRTGFAHLFEHLMFGGSKYAKNFDDFIQTAGGENNAFTNQDMTVYYDVVPLANLDVSLWLEADRMQNLILNKKALNTQRKVVVEEFKETCTEEPYGDIWHHIGPLVYEKHPYRVPTIGETYQHIEEASLEDVAHFFENYYCPNNAIISICANMDPDQIFERVKYWFETIPKGPSNNRQLPVEPPITAPKVLHVEAEVPVSAFYLVFHAAARLDDNYYLDDVLSDILGDGDASRLYKKLVKELQLISEMDAYITGTNDIGLFVIEGKLTEDSSFEKVEKAIWEQLERLQTELLSEDEVQKIKNRIEHNLEFAEMSPMHKAISLGYYELLGQPNLINEEGDHYLAITAAQLQERARNIFNPQQAAVIYYHAKDTDS